MCHEHEACLHVDHHVFIHCIHVLFHWFYLLFQQLITVEALLVS